MKTCVFLFISLFLLSGHQAFGQDDPSHRNDLARQALGRFEEKKYAEAMFFFNRLLELYPGDPGYAYSAGVCLTELNRDLPRAIEYLSFASTGDAPDEVWFYLGKAHFQMADYAGALKHFRRYAGIAGKQDLKELQVDSFIELCELKTDPAAKDGFRSMDRRDVLPLGLDDREPEPDKPVPEATSEYDRLIGEALLLQAGADSTRKVAAIRRNSLPAITDPAQKNRRENEILALERESFDWQGRANEKFLAAAKLEQEERQKTGASMVPLKQVQGAATVSSPAPSPDEIPAVNFDDGFFRQTKFRKLLKGNVVVRLEELDRIKGSGDVLFSRAAQEEKKVQEYQLKADGARNSTEQKKYLSRMEKEKLRVLDDRLRAFEYYQQVNEERYSLFKTSLEGLTAGKYSDEAKAGIQYLELAGEHYNKAEALRNEAARRADDRERYQKLVESNAYQLLSLENQKRAFEALLGLRGPAEPRQSLAYLAEIPAAPGITASRQVPVEANSHAQGNPSLPAQPATVQSPSPQRSILPTADPAEPAVVLPVEPAVRPENVDGLLYKIQIGVFSSNPAPSLFAGLGVISTEYIPEMKLTRYYSGRYVNFQEAQKAVKEAQEKGFPQAFVVASYQGTKISVNRAKVIEGEKNRPALQAPEREKTLPADTRGLPVYKVQVGAFRGDLPQSLINRWKDAAPDHSPEKRINNEGINLYSLGNFLTFEEAQNLCRQLVEKGISDAFVVAYKDGEKIPVDQARVITAGNMKERP